MNAPQILACVAGVLALVACVKPSWQVLPAAVLILAIAVLVK